LHGKVSTTLSRAVKMRFHTASVDSSLLLIPHADS
jgi:hypothetical protein